MSPSEAYSKFLDACQKNDHLEARLIVMGNKESIIALANWYNFVEEGMGLTLALEILLENGADVNTRDSNGATALYMACKSNQLSNVKLLLKHGANTELTKHDLTPLMVAARKGSLECIKALVEHGANIHCKGYDGENAVYYAVTGRQPHVLEYLLKLGVPCDGPIRWAENNENCLDLAIEEENQVCANILYKWGLKPNIYTWRN
ncbi:ankyrin repeat domain-containing protein [Paenibacillus cellulositrophicus]|uniref:ankyrin repeat domain-containing protein n=1 Tax=Paenibacillus cellulositrophicus TaxID=562959 RepID=UPI003F7E2637